MRRALAAQQCVERPLREIDALFAELEIMPAAAPIRVFWVNAPFFKTDAQESYIACPHLPDAPNPVFFKGSNVGGLSTVDFADVEVVEEHLALLVVTDRVQGRLNTEYLAEVAERLSITVFANVACPALEGTAFAEAESIEKSLSTDFGHSTDPGTGRVALFATDLVARPAYDRFEINPMTLGPATVAAGKFLALTLESEPVGSEDVIKVCQGIPGVLRNKRRVRDALPINTVMEISGSKFRFNKFQSVGRTSIAHAATLDTIRRYVTWYLLDQGRTAANNQQLSRNQDALNRILAPLVNKKSLLCKAEVNPDASKVAPDATGRQAQHFQLVLAFDQPTELYYVTLQVA